MHSQTPSRSRYARSRIVTVALLALLFSAAPCHATCYFPDGSTATNMETCPDSKSCCGKNQACLSNGLCFGADLGVIYRGSCSDKSWPIADCPRACYTEISDSYANLFQCPGNGDWKNMTCSSRGDAETACGVDAAGSWEWVSGGTVTSGQNGVSTCSNVATGATNLTDSTSSTQTSCPACTDPASQSSSHSAVALGAGLGAGLGVPLLISTALLIYCISARRRLLSGPQRQMNMNQPIAGQSRDLPSELDEGTYVAEMGSKDTRSELPG